MSRTRLPAAAIAADYQAGLGIIELAAKYDCSQTGIRKALTRVGVAMRPRGGVTRNITSEQIVALRDVDRLSWADISAQTGMTEEALRGRYQLARGGLPASEWHRVAARHPELSVEQLRQLNSVVDHRDDIVAAYLSGQASAIQLAREHGISDTTVRNWAARHHTNPDR